MKIEVTAEDMAQQFTDVGPAYLVDGDKDIRQLSREFATTTPNGSNLLFGLLSGDVHPEAVMYLLTLAYMVGYGHGQKSVAASRDIGELDRMFRLEGGYEPS